MKDDESIQDMHTRFTSSINELHSLGDIIPRNKLVKKILSVLPGSWESKVNAITEAKDLQELTIDELVGNLKTYEMKKKKDNERREPKGEKNLVLKTDSNDSGGEDAHMAYLTKRFQKMVRRNRGIPKGGNSSKPKDLKETIESLKKEKDALTKKVANIEHEREDLVVVVVNLKETIECVKKEKEVLTERVANIEHEKDDLLVVVIDLKETIEELKRESRPGNTQKGKKVGIVKGSIQQWYMDNGCSKHMTGGTNDFLSLKALQGGSVSFVNANEWTTTRKTQQGPGQKYKSTVQLERNIRK
ncbi:PREDICTED: uncharacterized protein LOC109218192 [Nicotiana attenuata]|uniref:uncharacterized protein LOC109218192 n=1 Tax=Nicotiana attenuata TaxID=49451 RepID=UPI00090558F4|nr:PREDICTED: uncharacterized protein LOC109218192 [Nicotiana attenuata]